MKCISEIERTISGYIKLSELLRKFEMKKTAQKKFRLPEAGKSTDIH